MSDSYVVTSAALIDAALAGLDSDEPDVVPALVDRVVEHMRAELVEAITAGVAAG